MIICLSFVVIERGRRRSTCLMTEIVDLFCERQISGLDGVDSISFSGMARCPHVPSARRHRFNIGGRSGIQHRHTIGTRTLMENHVSSGWEPGRERIFVRQLLQTNSCGRTLLLIASLII